MCPKYKAGVNINKIKKAEDGDEEKIECCTANGECPALYKSKNGKYYVQGLKVNQSIKLKLNLPQSDELVEVPKKLIDLIKEL